MKKLLVLFILFSSAQSCTKCKRCARDDVELRCIKPNDTLVSNWDICRSAYIDRYYPGGDSTYYLNFGGSLDEVNQVLVNAGYDCAVNSLNHRSKQDVCGNTDRDISNLGNLEHTGYTCK